MRTLSALGRIVLGIGALGVLGSLGWAGLRAREIQNAHDDVRTKRAAHSKLVEAMIGLDGFALDKTEVTVAEYRECVKAGACTEAGRGELCNGEAKGFDSHPINCVDQTQASAFCAWTGRRLPTAKEWELAACGRDGRTYAWPGHDTDGRECLERDVDYGPGSGARILSPAKGTCPVDEHPNGATDRGVLGLGGNVSEWTSTEIGAPYPSSNRWATMGPSWVYRRFGPDIACSAQRAHAPTQRDALLGFRCAKSEPPSVWSELMETELQLARSSTTAMP